MISVQKAYDICKKENPGKQAVSAIDYGKYFLFKMINPKTNYKNVYSGTCLDAVDKQTGEYGLYDIISDDSNIKPIKIDLSELGL